MEKNAKRTGFDCSVDIECAIEMLKKIKYSKIDKIIVQKCSENIKIAIKKYSFFKKYDIIILY